MLVSAAAAVVISNGVVVARLWARDTGTQQLDRNFPFLPVSICTTFRKSYSTECRNESKMKGIINIRSTHYVLRIKYVNSTINLTWTRTKKNCVLQKCPILRVLLILFVQYILAIGDQHFYRSSHIHTHP